MCPHHSYSAIALKVPAALKARNGNKRHTLWRAEIKASLCVDGAEVSVSPHGGSGVGGVVPRTVVFGGGRSFQTGGRGSRRRSQALERG